MNNRPFPNFRVAFNVNISPKVLNFNITIPLQFLQLISSVGSEENFTFQSAADLKNEPILFESRFFSFEFVTFDINFFLSTFPKVFVILFLF